MLTRRALMASLAAAGFAPAQQPATMHLRARSRREGIPFERTLLWRPAETAIIICDMWNDHYCKSSARRLEQMVPRMNRTLNQARSIGVHIIHAPSGTMDQYEGTEQRIRMKSVARVTPPVPIANWCYLDLKDESPLPIDDATEPCDDDRVGARVRVFNRQHAGLEIKEPDGVSDSGPEIYSFFVREGVKHVALMGVHTNMCVLGRPFGIRQLKRLGMDVVLARDLTDAMYDPRQAPWVSHERGTSLVIEHVEKFWCPTVLGDDLTRTAKGAAA